MSTEQRTVNAPTFAAWWTELVTRARDQPDNDGVNNLIKILYEVGLRSQATEPCLRLEDNTPESSASVIRLGQLSRSFDWVAGEIDFSGLHINADTLIESLVHTTGIKERDNDEFPLSAK